MPNPDGSLNWNDPGFQSSLQQYQNLGGDMNRAAEWLYTGAGRTDPTQASGTIQQQIQNMEGPPSDWQIQRNIDRDQAFGQSMLGSGAYNPGGANSYLIQNSIGQNSGYKPKLNWGIGQVVPKSTWMQGGIVPGSSAATASNLAAAAAGNGSSINTGTYTGTPYTGIPATGERGGGGSSANGTPVDPAITAAGGSGTGNQTRTNTGNNQAETLAQNSIDLNKNRSQFFKRGNAGGYSNGAQYFQSASLPGGTNPGAGSGFGGLGYSSANGGSGWGGGNNWNRYLWR